MTSATFGRTSAAGPTSRLLLLAVALILALAAMVPVGTPRARAANPQLAEWTFDFTVHADHYLYSDIGNGLYQENTEALDMHFSNSDADSNDMEWTWDVARTFYYNCSSGTPGDFYATADGAAGSTAPFVAGVENPITVAAWGQTGDWTDLSGYLGEVTTHMVGHYCDGTPIDQYGTEIPQTFPLMLPGTLEELDASPVGTKLEYSYDQYTGTATNYQDSVVTAVAEKIDPSVVVPPQAIPDIVTWDLDCTKHCPKHYKVGPFEPAANDIDPDSPIVFVGPIGSLPLATGVVSCSATGVCYYEWYSKPNKKHPGGAYPATESFSYLIASSDGAATGQVSIVPTVH